MPTKTSFKGKCPRCGRSYYSRHKGETIICDCWRRCPLCGAEMQPYTPDFAPKTYGMDGKRDLRILMFCDVHTPVFYSTQKPVEVVCE